MEIGTEISQKIRSAIKAKLIELGTYVDDELPDYIMVMVANKKTQQQMTNDLHLFLSVHTETFTTWLHSLLKKLQSINTDEPILSDEPPGKEKEKPKVKEKPKGEKKRRPHPEKTDKTHSGKTHAEKTRTEKTHPERSHSDKSHSHSEKSHSAKPHSAKSHSEKSVPEKSRTERRRKSSESAKTKRSSSKEQPKAETVKPVPPTKETVKTDDNTTPADKTAEPQEPDTEELNDELNITENTDEFAEEVKEEKVKKRPRSKSPPPKATKAEKHSDAKKVKKAPPKTGSRRKAEKVDNVPKSKAEAEKRKHSPSSSTSDSKRKPSSVVGTHKRLYEELEAEEEGYDPMNPAVGNVASGIRIPSRKSSVPKALQANCSLLRKAVNEAERSVAIVKKEKTSPQEKLAKKSSRKKESGEDSSHSITGRIKTAAGLQLISKSRRKEMMQKMTYTVDNKPSTSEAADENSSDSRDSIPNLKYTVKNEASKKGPHKSKSISKAVASSRMAASALKEISKNAGKDPENAEKAESVDTNDEEYGPVLPDSRRVNVKQAELSPELTGSEEEPDLPVGVTIKKEPSEASGSVASDEGVADPEIQKILEEATDGNFDLTDNISRLYFVQENKRVINKDKWTPSPDDSDDDTRFIVTLDGVRPEILSSLPETKQAVRQQAVKPMPKDQSATEEVLPTKDGTTDYTKMQPPKIKPFNINLKDSDDEGEDEMAVETVPETKPEDEMVKQTSILERCRFWPACANGNSCQYVHPTVACKTFPYCKFGDKCIYIHPNCKYDAKCTRHDCPFTHASKRSGFAPTVIHKYVQMPMQPPIPAFPTSGLGYPPSGGGYQPPGGGGYQPPSGGGYQPPGGGGYQPPSYGYKSDGAQQCKFYPNCSNMTCPYVHPKPCRFGMGCRNQVCTFYHPPVPTKDKLKWSKASSASFPGGLPD